MILHYKPKMEILTFANLNGIGNFPARVSHTCMQIEKTFS